MANNPALIYAISLLLFITGLIVTCKSTNIETLNIDKTGKIITTTINIYPYTLHGLILIVTAIIIFTIGYMSTTKDEITRKIT